MGFEHFTATANNVAHAGASADKTILQIATPSGSRGHLISATVMFDGVTASNIPVEVRLQRQTNVGTGGVALGTNYGINPLDPASPPSALTALKGIWATTEPSMSSIIMALKVPPTSGVIYQFPLGQEIDIAVSAFFGLVVNAANAVNVWANFTWRE